MAFKEHADGLVQIRIGNAGAQVRRVKPGQREEAGSAIILGENPAQRRNRGRA